MFSGRGKGGQRHTFWEGYQRGEVWGVAQWGRVSGGGAEWEGQRGRHGAEAPIGCRGPAG